MNTRNSECGMIRKKILSLITEAYGHPALIVHSLKEKKATERRRIKAFGRLMQIVSIIALLLLLLGNYAQAQESSPKYKFQQPSDEMDFTLPPISDIPEGLPPINDQPKGEGLPALPDVYNFESSTLPSLPPTDDSLVTEKKPGIIDQFFSTTTILAPDAPLPDASLEEKKPEEPIKPAAIKRKYRKPAPSLPAFNFKSVRLPSTIYHKRNGKEDEHLPFAYMVDDQQQLLINAVKKDDIETVRSLWRNGAVTAWSSADGEPIIGIAAQHHSINVARWLLMHGTNPNDTDGVGLTPLHYAAYSGNHQMVELLLMYGANRQLTDAQGKTPLMYAQLHPVSNIVQKMLSF
jgi:Ankyrin repeats (3 copies)